MLNLQLVLQHPDKSTYYTFLEEDKIIGLKNNVITKYDFNNWKINKLNKENIADETNKSKFYIKDLIVTQDNKILEEQIKTVEDILGHPLDIQCMGFYKNGEEIKDIILTKEDVYYLRDREATIFSEGKLSNKDLNINFIFKPYQPNNISCQEYGAVLGDLVRNDMLELKSRNNLLKNLSSCKSN